MPNRNTIDTYPEPADIWLYEEPYNGTKGHLFILNEEFDFHHGTYYTILCLETGLIDKFTKNDIIIATWKKVA